MVQKMYFFAANGGYASKKLNDWCVQEFSNFRISYQFLTVLPTCFEEVYMYGGDDYLIS